MKNILILIIIFFSVSCKEKEPKLVLTEINNNAIYVENNEYLNFLKSKLKKINPTEKKYRIVKQAFPNNKNKELIDTITTIIFKKNRIYYYKTQNRNVLHTAEIENNEWGIFEKVNIGMNKKTLNNLLSIKTQVDTIKIGNKERSIFFTFIFNPEKLKKIRYYKYVE